MEAVSFFETESIEGKENHVIIDNGNDKFTSMLKSTYDAQQAAVNDISE